MLWQPGLTLEQVEKEVILQAMRFYHNNKTQTARSLGIAIRTLDHKLERYRNGNSVQTEGGIHVQPSSEPTEKQTLSMRQQEEIQMLVRRFADVPIVKTFTFDWYSHGRLNADKPFASPILMHYELTNDEQNKLGAFPLQPGKVRIFIEDGRGGQAFLGEDVSKLTPLDDKMRLYLGQSRDIVCSRLVEKNQRHVVRGNLHHQEIILKYEIENFRDKAATLDIVEQLNRDAAEFAGNPQGDVEWEMGEQTSREIRFSYEKGNANPILHVKLDARPKDPEQEVEKKTVRFHFTLKNIW